MEAFNVRLLTDAEKAVFFALDAAGEPLNAQRTYVLAAQALLVKKVNEINLKLKPKPDKKIPSSILAFLKDEKMIKSAASRTQFDELRKDFGWDIPSHVRVSQMLKRFEKAGWLISRKVGKRWVYAISESVLPEIKSKITPLYSW